MSPTRHRWMRVPIAILLFAMLLPVATVATPPDPAAAQSSDSLCTGDLAADYYGPCGPSLTHPAWSDAKGWNGGYAENPIELFDLNGDGKDELVGAGPLGVEVYSFNSQFGEWVLAYDPTKPLPFPNPPSEPFDQWIRYGQLADGVWGLVGLTGAGLETWSWNPGDGTLASGYWTLENQYSDASGLFGTTGWFPNAFEAYWTPLQFVRGQLEGLGYSIIARGADGMHACGWDHGGKQWNCVQAGSAFNDSVMTDSNGNLADYYYTTIQTIDLYHETAGPELVGLDNQSQSLVTYSWDPGSKQFTPLTISGNAPFWSPQGQWLNMKYSSTIQPVQLLGSDQPSQIIGRSAQGLEYHSVNSSGCGGHTPPCWKNLTNLTGNPISDYAGYGEEQYYGTMRFADLDNDGIDELIVRDPTGTVLSFALHPNAGWYALPTFRLTFTGGPADDPLWSSPGYYTTIQAGDITGDGRIYLTARGKYGIRTFGYWDKVGWGRPRPYGFPAFSSAEQNAYNLANAFVGLNPNSGKTLRTLYYSDSSTKLQGYHECLIGSMTVPTSTCAADTNGGPLSNPNGVTDQQWQSMATLLADELNAAVLVSEHIAAVDTLLTHLFFQDITSLSKAITQLFPAAQPDPHQSVFMRYFNLFVGFSEAAASAIPVAGGGINAGLYTLEAILGAMQSMQTPQNPLNAFEARIDEIQGQIDSLTTEALDRNNEIHQYITADASQLALYGSMLEGGFWVLTGETSTAAQSFGGHHNATWVYQTILPVVWQAYACRPQPYENVLRGSCSVFNNISMGVNATEIPGTTNWIALIGHRHKDAVKPNDATLNKIFGPVGSNCTVGSDNANATWRYSCNLGLQLTDFLSFVDGWSAIPCEVALWQPPYNDSIYLYKCGDGPPDGYGPPPSS